MEMPQTLYASFADISLAEKAAGALLDNGVRAEDISLIANHSGQDADKSGFAAHSATLEERATRSARPLPMDDEATFTSGHSGVQERRSLGNEIAEGGDRFGARVSSALGATNVAANYEAAADARASGERGYTAAVGGADNLETNSDEGDVTKTDLSAKHGISTTTPGDAWAGAAKGAGIGLGVGVLAALASLAIPGFGIIAGGGALATAIAGAAGTTVGGAVAGGAFGYLKDQGVPEEAAERLNRVYQGGGAVIAVTVPSNGVDQISVESILNKYQAENVSTYGTAMAA
jgi:hypothetical protein